MKINSNIPSFPNSRPRRLRQSPALRDMLRETSLIAKDLILPLFVVYGEDVREEIASMPGQYQWSLDLLAEEAIFIKELGIPAVILFGIPTEKDPIGLENFSPDGIIQKAIRVIKSAVPEMIVITDVCLCEYTDHGHCGILNRDQYQDEHLPFGYVLNDATLEILGKVAVSHAQAGADMVAPSGMMDGMVAAIRTALDDDGFSLVPLLSYAVKFASAFYGPFRDAADGAPKFGDRKSHQMDPANSREALREAALDIAEGADMLMVKPGLPYLDIISQISSSFNELPIVAYNVSGEYAMVKAAAANGWLDEKSVVMEIMTAFKRAGCDLIITYHAKDVAAWLQE